jgi:hypothetical protein
MLFNHRLITIKAASRNDIFQQTNNEHKSQNNPNFVLYLETWNCMLLNENYK